MATICSSIRSADKTLTAAGMFKIAASFTENWSN
jgi:hypothetical protein